MALLGLVSVLTGGADALLGPDAVVRLAPWPVDLDSHFRYLSGLFLALGLVFYATIPAIENKTYLFRTLAAMVVAGGLARLLPLLAGLILELIVVPLLVLWQARIARRGLELDG